MGLLGPLFRWDALESLALRPGAAQAMLDFEAALARAEARTGVIPASAAAAIAARLRRGARSTPTRSRARRAAGNLAIPLVQQLTALVAQRRSGSRALRPLGRDQPGRHRHRPRAPATAGRGVVDGRARPAGAARWPSLRGPPPRARPWRAGRGCSRRRPHIRAESGGLAGRDGSPTRSATASCAAVSRPPVRRRRGHAGRARRQGLAVAAALAEELSLALPDLPWHAHRDRLARARRPRSASARARWERSLVTSRCTRRPRWARLCEPAAAGAAARPPCRTSGTLWPAPSPWPRPRACPAWWPRAGGDAPGARARPGGLARGVGDAARDRVALRRRAPPPDGSARRAARGRGADARRTSTSPGGLVFAEAVQMALAPRTGRAAAKRSWRRPAPARASKVATCATFSPTTRRRADPVGTRSARRSSSRGAIWARRLV